jgi:DDE superfamily endonuclease
MEDVLKVYARPYDPRYPVVCMDEASRQLTSETRTPFIDSHGVTHMDNEYIRHGQQSIFLATEPLGQWRTTSVTDHRTAVDWAHFMKVAVIDRYPDATKIVLVMDNLNTHKLASFYEAYPPEEASRLADRLEIHYTPKHGSWLDIAEIELSVMQNQCLGERRIASKEQLTKELSSWATARNDSQKGVRWQFTTKEARTKLLRLYPKIELAVKTSR